MHRANRLEAVRTGGFTLIEMMIVVVILAILAAVAIPSYSNFVMRGRLTDAHAKLGDLRGQMERYFLDNRTYQDTTGTACGIDDAAINMTATYNADGGRSFDITCAAADVHWPGKYQAYPAYDWYGAFARSVVAYDGGEFLRQSRA